MRKSGILMHISSLPSKYGIGTLGKAAYDFIDHLAEAGQSLWQILPLGPTGFGDSPYQSFSTYAGNPYFIDLEILIERGWLKKRVCDRVYRGINNMDVDYQMLYQTRFLLLKEAFEAAKEEGYFKKKEYRIFCDTNAYWLKDYTLFMAIKKEYAGKSFIEWPKKLRERAKDALKDFAGSHAEDIAFYEFLQFEFFQQWSNLKKYAGHHGIEIIGDIPIYVAFDSADTWANPHLFQLSKFMTPKSIAGCPPDGFAANGQLWGNPLYDWEAHKKEGFVWWLSRIRHCFEMVDVLRIDHFRGFDEYFSIPFGESTAAGGHWEKGPGFSLFEKIKQELGQKRIIAEDLGYVTDSVRELVDRCKYPGMKVLQFAFDSRDTGNAADYLPHNYDRNCVVYTGTHDNATLLEWLFDISEEEYRAVCEYIGARQGDTKEVLVKELIRTAMASVADMCIIPIQDYLVQGGKARMNRPSTLGTNWRYRIGKKDMSKKKIREIYDLTKRYAR